MNAQILNINSKEVTSGKSISLQIIRLLNENFSRNWHCGDNVYSQCFTILLFVCSFVLGPVQQVP